MAVYNNRKPDSPLLSVEFSPTPTGNMSFFRVDTQADGEALKPWLASLGQQVLAQTQVNGHPVLVTQGGKSAEMLLQALAAKGEKLAPVIAEKKFNPWWWRGFTSFVGQGFMLLSGFRSKGADRGAIMTFAATNLTANVGNMIFGAQRKDDPHQLQALKEKVDKRLQPYVSAAQQPGLPALTNTNLKLVEEANTERPFGRTVGEFLKRHSVSFMEIGLRTFGSIALMTPLRKPDANGKYVFQWGNAAKALGRGKLKEAYDIVKTTNDFTRHYGELMVTGKMVSFLSKEPDPYNPKPHTWIDTLREKWTFRASSAIEGTGAIVGAYDRLFRYKKRGESGPDYIGGLGNIVFIGGYIIRWFASYGSKEVDMDALGAYVADALARVPPAQLPKALAEVSGDLTAHFEGKMFRGEKDKTPRPLTFSDIYAELTSALKSRYPAALPEGNAVAFAAPHIEKTVAHATPDKKSLAPAARPASFTEAALMAPASPALAAGM